MCIFTRPCLPAFRLLQRLSLMRLRNYRNCPPTSEDREKGRFFGICRFITTFSIQGGLSIITSFMGRFTITRMTTVIVGGDVRGYVSWVIVGRLSYLEGDLPGPLPRTFRIRARAIHGCTPTSMCRQVRNVSCP